MISVLYSPLFTAVYLDESTKRVGLMELLINAHNIVDIKANSCTGKVALLRLCIAFLCDAYRPESVDDRQMLLESGQFEADRLEQYVAKCESDGACFDLDDDKHPFMQAAYDEKLDARAEKPVSKILFDVPSGNNHIHTDHRQEGAHSVDDATAFEAMLETYMFCPAGLSGASNVNNTPPIYAILYGDNLFETLVLNMVSIEEGGNIPYGKVAWMAREEIVPGKQVVEMSVLRAWTWQPRRLKLEIAGDGNVSKVFLQNGLNFKGNELWLDPHVLYHKTKDDRWASIKPEMGRELWRDAGSIVRNGKGVKSTIPLTNVEDVWLNSPVMLEIELYGLITNQESILGRTSERLKLPRILFEDDALASDFSLALEIVERMYRDLVKIVVRYYCHSNDKKKKSTVAEQAGGAFLLVMRSFLFGAYLQSLVAGETGSQRWEGFMDEVWWALDKEALEGVVDQTGFDVQSLKRQNDVRSSVRASYNTLRKEVSW